MHVVRRHLENTVIETTIGERDNILMPASCNYILLCVVYWCRRTESGDKIFQLICLLHSSLKLALQASLPALLDSPRDQRSYRQSPCTVLGHRTQGSRSVAVHHEWVRIRKALWSYMLCHHWAAFPGSNDTGSMLGIGRSVFFCSWASRVSLLGDYDEEAGAHHFLLAFVKEHHGGSAKTASIRRPFM